MKNTTQLSFSILALVVAMLILIYFDTYTLFLATTLIAIVSIKRLNTEKKEHYIDKLIGIWFALSVAPSFGVSIDKISNFENGFLVQAILSFVFYLAFIEKKPSIIGRLSRKTKGSIAIVADDIIAGFAAGISSSLIWQIFNKFL